MKVNTGAFIVIILGVILVLSGAFLEGASGLMIIGAFVIGGGLGSLTKK